MPKLRYPILDEDRLLRSKIVFSVHEVDPPSFEGLDGIKAQPTLDALKSRTIGSLTTSERVDASKGEQALTEFEDIEELARRKEEIQNEVRLQTLANENIGVSALKVRPTGDIIDLYLPPAFQSVDNLEYDTSALNISGATALGALNAGSGALQSLAKGISEGTQSITDFFTGGTAGVAGRLAAARLASSPAGIFVPEGLRNAIGLAAQITVNPNLATTFNRVNIRPPIVFQFKFFPKSPEESIAVKRIIKMFRRRSHPENINIGDIPVGFRYPDLFKVRLLSGKSGEFKNVGMPIQMAFLTNIITNFNTTSAALHEDGAPNEVDLTLQFQEYRPLTRETIDAEDTDRFYEYYGRPSEAQLFQSDLDNYRGGI